MTIAQSTINQTLHDILSTCFAEDYVGIHLFNGNAGKLLDLHLCFHY